MFVNAFKEQFRDSAKLLAICDINQGRMDKYYNDFAKAGLNPTRYLAKNFDLMLKEHCPDGVIVCTTDSTHDDYICRALEAGCDVITEKPMATDEHKCQRIIDAVKKTGKKVRVTFNFRYAPVRSQIKDMLQNGIIGKVLSVDFQYLLDTQHGADYFRRWHSNKACSGGLLVHKSTHHFDLINWWLGSAPDSVFGHGGHMFYNKKQAWRYGLEGHGRNCRECKLKERCNFYIDISRYYELRDLYLECEKYDGYMRDQCLFRDSIDIEDCIQALVRYKSGAMLNYSLITFNPWEGYRVSINGTKGRIEHQSQVTTSLNGDGKVEGALKCQDLYIRVYPHFKTPYEVKVWQGQGSHDGGDTVMLRDIFNPASPDPLQRSADYVQGAYSILTGIAANKSIAANKPYTINELVHGLGDPKFLTVPGEDEHIGFVEDSKLIDPKGNVALISAPIEDNAKKKLPNPGVLKTISK